MIVHAYIVEDYSAWFCDVLLFFGYAQTSDSSICNFFSFLFLLCRLLRVVTDGYTKNMKTN